MLSISESVFLSVSIANKIGLLDFKPKHTQNHQPQQQKQQQQHRPATDDTSTAVCGRCQREDALINQNFKNRGDTHEHVVRMFQKITNENGMKHDNNTNRKMIHWVEKYRCTNGMLFIDLHYIYSFVSFC